MTPASILLIATRQIGDVLLTTPLLRSMRRAWPLARIDILVYTNKGGMLEGNPDCDAVIESDEHPNFAGYRTLFSRIFRRYDLAVTTQANDRGHLYAFLAGRQRIGLIPDTSNQSAWKRRHCTKWTLLDNIHTHTVVQNLSLASEMGITPLSEVVPPDRNEEELDQRLLFSWQTDAFVVLHPYPMWRYKRWTDAGWRALLEYCIGRGWRVVLSGGPDNEEREYCMKLASTRPEAVSSLAGNTSFGALARLLRKATAYVGPDTATTHLAAACGTPVLTLYGPTNPVKWGPWPISNKSTTLAQTSPWSMRSLPWQRVGNVLILQAEERCVPCLEEGCDRHKNSDSKCLLSLPASRVIAALEALLTQQAS